MLVEAGARRWNVAASTLRTENGMVIGPDGKKLSYGELATEASAIPVPTEVKLKDVKDFKIIGTAVSNVDAGQYFIQASLLFGLDFYREGMVHAMIQRPAAFGTKIKSVDATAAKAVPGIIDVVTFKNNVAVVGKSTWQVLKARKLLKIEYEPDGTSVMRDADHDRHFQGAS